MACLTNTLPVQRAADLECQALEHTWLIHSLWGRAAVGIIGGAPKSCKSWLGLDMALSVASSTACLGQFPVKQPGPALVYLAEDALPAIRSRLEALCTHRQLDIRTLDLHVITSPTLWLDQPQDQGRLQTTLEQLKPRLLLLDPLVRLHTGDENSSADISKLLGFLRTLQRTYDTAVVLVHHASKKHRAQPGQALRGSSDLHAFGDSNLYLARNKTQLTLTFEHRSAKAPDPMTLELISSPEGTDTHLAVCSLPVPDRSADLSERVLLVLQNTACPLSRKNLRETLKVNNQRLGETLQALQKQGVAVPTEKGWVMVRSTVTLD